MPNQSRAFSAHSFFWSITLLFCLSARGSWAQDCDAVLQRGIFNTTSIQQSSSLNTKFNEYIYDVDFQTHQQALDAGISLGTLVYGIPLKLGATFSQEQKDTWRREHTQYQNSSTQAADSYDALISTVSDAVLDAWTTCHTTPHLGLTGRLDATGGGSDAILFLSWVKNVGDNGPPPIVTGSSITGGSRPGSPAAQVIPVGTVLKEGTNANLVQLVRTPTKPCVVVINTTRGDVSCFLRALPKPTIKYFTAANSSLQNGETTSLRWSVDGADEVRIDNGVGSVSATNSASVTPTGTITYTLTARNEVGTASRSTTVSVAPPPPVLTGGSVFFHTTNDDKDGNTSVAVYIKSGGNTVAQWSGTEGHWDDNSDHGPYGLNVITQIRKAELIGAGQAVLIESPKGDDEWHFTWRVTLSFSDGTTKQYDWGGDVDSDRATLTNSLP